MKRSQVLALALAAGATLLASGAARASDVRWSIGISLPPVATVISGGPVHGAPGVVYAPAPVYGPEPVYYPAPVYRPEPVYYPAPVFRRPAPVVVAPPIVYRPPRFIPAPRPWIDRRQDARGVVHRDRDGRPGWHDRDGRPGWDGRDGRRRPH